MKAQHFCFPCCLKQVERVGQITNCSEATIQQLKQEIDKSFSSIDLQTTPVEIGYKVQQQLTKAIGIPDPYKEVRKQSTQKALEHYDRLKNIVEESTDRLATALRIAAAGNMIDFGAKMEFDLDNDLPLLLNHDFDRFDYAIFKEELSKAQKVLYLGDNAGETVFDRILIETLDKEVEYVVRSHPIINDALVQDAIDAGIDQTATIIESGTPCPGTVLSTCSPQFKKKFEEAEVIISKGQGNYEALSDVNRSVFFLFKVKCDLVAKHAAAKLGSLALISINTTSNN